MLRSIQKLIGDKRKQLIFPVFLMSLDAIGSLVMYLMLYFTVIHLLNGSLTGGLVRNYTIVCLISIILRLIIYRSGYFLCFSRGAEMCSGLRLDLANHYRSLSLGYFNQNSSGYLLSTLTKDLSNFELVFGLMEDVGYMARISYVFDDTMTKLGLQGKAIMPFLVSFGCNIGGITGTRVIDSWGQRVMTIALSWVVPCASTWGVVGLVSGTFFGNGAAVVVLALFAVAFLHIFITYKVFGRSLNKVEGRTGLIMELPPYHKPHWKSLFGSVFSKMGNVLSRALRIIICISVIFWLLSYSADGNVANSIIYKVGTFIEPVTSLFGLPWQLFIAFVASAMGKEASLGVMASLFNTGSIWAAIEQSATVDTAALSTSMLSVISRPEALAFLFAFFFNMPCLMALTATTQETHSMKWTVRIALYYVLTALIMATIAYHVGLVIF